MSKISTKSSIVFTQSLSIFAQSSNLLPQSTKKWVQLTNVLSQSINKLTQSTNKWAQSTKGVRGVRGGVSTTNEGKLDMQSNQKMKYVASIHNDDMKCFHVVVQNTHKLVVMGRINFEDHVLIKKWWVG